MHVVTKILVVFCAVLSVVLAALTMAYSANADRIRDSLVSERLRAEAAESTARAEVAGFAQQKVSHEQERASLQASVEALTAQVADLQAERTALNAELARAVNTADAAQRQISAWGNTAQVNADTIKNFRDEVTRLRDEMVSAQRREVELVDRINDLTAQNEVLEQNTRALREQLTEARTQVESLQQGGTGSMASATPRELSGPVIRASVSEVFRSPSGDNMVVISEGANRGIRENVLMNIVRGDAFVAQVQITTVEPQRAVGKVLYSANNRSVQEDDTVLSRLF